MDDSRYVYIGDRDPAAVLAALYNASRPLGIGFIHYTPEDMTVEQARGLLLVQEYFDYLKGRVMKVDLGKEALEREGGRLFVGLYDRDNGPGAAARVIEGVQRLSGSKAEV